MGENNQYFWVVLCKNHQFHSQQKLFHAHKILLAAADALVSAPTLNERLKVQCDDCGQEYSYEPKEILRAQLESHESFTPHPLFR